MKILVQKEGFNFAYNHIFGDFGPFWSEFTWICDYETKSPDSPGWSISFHYALTSDGYVLLGKAGQGVDPIIVAQVRRFGKDPESCIKELLGMYVTKARLWGLPYPGSFTSGGLFRRFDAAAFGFNLWKWISIRIMEAQENPPAIVEFLESRHLMTMPDGESDGSWVCVCPSCRRKLLHFQRESEHWLCDACHLSGIRHEDLIATIDEVRSLKEFNLGNDRLQMN